MRSINQIFKSNSAVNTDTMNGIQWVTKMLPKLNAYQIDDAGDQLTCFCVKHSGTGYQITETDRRQRHKWKIGTVQVWPLLPSLGKYWHETFVHASTNGANSIDLFFIIWPGIENGWFTNRRKRQLRHRCSRWEKQRPKWRVHGARVDVVVLTKPTGHRPVIEMSLANKFSRHLKHC